MDVLGAMTIGVAAVWGVSEVVLGRTRHSKGTGARSADRATFPFLWLTIAASVALGVFLGMSRIGALPGLVPGVILVGLGLMVAGLVVRFLAIRTLARFFTVDVAIHPDHTVVDTGLYRHVRHPAYLGSLLSFLGLGFAMASWVSVLVIFVPVTAAFLVRIRQEERALVGALGEPYRQYLARTARLVPGLF